MADLLNLKIKQLSGEVFSLKVQPDVSYLQISLQILADQRYRTETKSKRNDRQSSRDNQTDLQSEKSRRFQESLRLQ